MTQREIEADQQTIAFLDHSIEWYVDTGAHELVRHLRLARDRMIQNLQRFTGEENNRHQARVA